MPGRTQPARTPATLHVALMRGINVGGKNKLPMKDLAAIFAGAGCADVRTYIQSGNVVFTAPASVAGEVPGRVARGIESRFGIRSPVVTRSAAQFRGILEDPPFDEAHRHVVFLADQSGAADARRLDPDRSPGDEFRLVGREIYLSLPSGVARTKLTCDYFDRTLGTVSTMRNWRTVCRLAEMLA